MKYKVTIKINEWKKKTRKNIIFIDVEHFSHSYRHRISMSRSNSCSIWGKNNFHLNKTTNIKWNHDSGSRNYLSDKYEARTMHYMFIDDYGRQWVCGLNCECRCGNRKSHWEFSDIQLEMRMFERYRAEIDVQRCRWSYPHHLDARSAFSIRTTILTLHCTTVSHPSIDVIVSAFTEQLFTAEHP